MYFCHPAVSGVAFMRRRELDSQLSEVFRKVRLFTKVGSDQSFVILNSFQDPWISYNSNLNAGSCKHIPNKYKKKQ